MSDTKASSPQGDPEQGASKQDFAATVEQLEALVERLESGALSLEDSLTAFEQGVRLTREAQNRLDNAELTVRALSEDGDGRLTVTPFSAPDADATGEENPPW
jgi:exodeoxyribonuclease VII small subunit